MIHNTKNCFLIAVKDGDWYCARIHEELYHEARNPYLTRMKVLAQHYGDYEKAKAATVCGVTARYSYVADLAKEHNLTKIYIFDKDWKITQI